MSNIRETICPIWLCCDDGYELVGSSVLCAVGNETFLISAAHVLDLGNGKNLFVGTEAGYLPLTEKATLTNTHGEPRENDHIDIGYMRLSAQTVSHLFPTYNRLPIEWISVGNESTVEKAYMVSGCPWRKVVKSGRVFMPQLFSLTLRSY